MVGRREFPPLEFVPSHSTEISRRSSLHPVIRVAGLVALAVGLASAAFLPLAAASIILGVLAGMNDCYRPVFLSPLRRLKWLLVSILALYACMVPGEPLFPAWPSYSPTEQGIVQGMLRCWMLLLMAGSARLLMWTTSREDIMGALYWFTRPLEHVGLDSARFCMRLVLTLEYALALGRREPETGAREDSAGFTERAVAMARRRLEEAARTADEAPAGPVVIPRCGAPPLWQWMAPAALLVALLGMPGML